MNNSDTTKYLLNQHEQRLVRLFGEIYTIHGRSQNFGMTFAVLQLKAPNSARGMDQKTIQRYFETNFHSISISTISRILTQLAKQEYCDYIEERTRTYGRKRMKFFRKTSLKKVLEDRIDYAIKEFEMISNKLDIIKADALKNTDNNNDDLLSLITNLQDVYSLSKKLYQRLREMSEAEWSSL